MVKSNMGLWLARAFFVALSTSMVLVFRPFGLTFGWALGCGLGLSCILVVIELRVQHLSPKVILGAAVGSIVGMFGAALTSLVITNVTILSPETGSFAHVIILVGMVYMGSLVGAEKAEWINLSVDESLKKYRPKESLKVLDTSVIIDGRVADILRTGFMEGPLLLPEFVLKELQNVADSSDSEKRNRGRRGLDILKEVQKQLGENVQIIDKDYPEIPEVDLKLIELAKETGAKLVTNDFNLNKVAQLQGIEVLNINELANVLKPVVLPGEILRVFILKEGKESDQGVAYLDDGTMVVVDDARRMIGKTVNVAVTSVLQTTAGKMIFGRHPKVRKRSNYARERVTHL